MKNHLTIPLLALGLLSVIAAHAQEAPFFNWAKQTAKGPGYEYGNAVTSDGSGNVYTTGEFTEVIDVDPGTGVFNLTPTASGNRDIFITKLDANGNFIWGIGIGGSQLDGGKRIVTDATGNVYVAGYFGGPVDFDPGPGVFNLTSSGSFMLKLDGSGNFLWAKEIDDINIADMNLSAGGLYFTGNFNFGADFDPGPGTFLLSPQGGFTNGDAYVLKLDTDGNFVWAKRIGGPNVSLGNSVSVDASGNVYSAGQFTGTCDFDPDATATSNVTASGGYDMYVSKLDASGNFVWAKTFGNTSADEGMGVRADPSGNVAVTGFFSGVVDFDPGTGTFNLASAGSTDIAVFKLSATGSFMWAKAFGGTGADEVNAIDSDPSGNIYTTGYFRNTVDFDPGSATYNLTSAGNQEIFISKLDGAGNFAWATRTGSSSTDIGYHIHADASSHVYLTSFFYQTADFDPTCGIANLTSGGNTDAFVQKLTSGFLPTVTNVSPLLGPYGTSVTITGTNFSPVPGSNTVRFNGTLATVTAATPTSITTTVPIGASSGLVTARVGCYTAVSSQTFTVTSIPSNIPSAGLVGFWPFTGNANDISGNGNNGILNGPTLTSSHFGFANRAYAFDGNDYIKVNNSTSLQPGNVTVAGWFKFNSNTGLQLLVDKHFGSADFDSFEMWYENNLLRGTVGNASGLAPSVDYSFTPVIGDWYYLAYSFDDAANIHSLYVNGCLVKQASVNISIAYDSEPLLFGASNDFLTPTYFFNGSIDEIAIWNRALSLTEINSAMDNIVNVLDFNPSSGSVGTTVVIDGGNFSLMPSDNLVEFSGTPTPATVLSSTSTQLVVKVPAGAATGPIGVGRGCGGVTTESEFTVLSVSVPAISSFTPTSGTVLTQVVIMGNHFSTVTDDNIVYFGAAQSVVIDATATQLTVEVPFGATYEPISVTVSGLTAFSKSPFLVTFPEGGIIDACSFASHEDYVAPSQPFSIALSDLDGDGKSDLVVSSTSAASNGSLSIYRNISAKGPFTPFSFESPVDIVTASESRQGITTADIDGDGKKELITVSPSNNLLTIYQNLSSPGFLDASSFGSRVDFTTDVQPRHVVVTDLDGDGKPDVITSNKSGSISIFRNNSALGVIDNSSLGGGVNFSVTISPYGIAVGDLNNDGKPEIVVANEAIGGPISIFQNTSTAGSISLATVVNLTALSFPGEIAIGDIDGDGKPDLVAANQSGNKISVFRNLSSGGAISTGSFAARIDLAAQSPLGITLTDVDGDGKLDITASSNNSSDGFTVHRNISTPGTISVEPEVIFTTDITPYDHVVGDLDGDGKPDVVTANHQGPSISILRNTVSSLPPLTAVDFSPPSGEVGSTVFIVGDSFSTTLSNNVVLFNGVSAEIVSASSTDLEVIVPDGATSGLISVIVGCNTIDSPSSFQVRSAQNLIYYSRADGTIWSTQGDGSADLFITNGYWPKASPDGLFLLFHRGSQAQVSQKDIYVLDFQTGVETQVFANSDFAVLYSWTADDSQIVFDYGCSIEKMNSDGTGMFTVHGSDCFDDAPSVRFSDGQIVFHNANTGIGGLFIINEDGSGRTHIPNTSYGDFWPSWSPDEQWITFSRYTGPTFTAQYKIHPDGTGLTKLTNLTGSESLGGGSGGGGAWNADGSAILIVGIIDCRSGLFEVAADGSNVIQRIAASSATSPFDFVGGVVGNPTLSYLPLYSAPTITSFSPPVGPVGAVVTITGTNFSPNPSDNTVKFNGVSAIVTSSTATDITTTVPAGATSGPISVTAGCSTAASSGNFVVSTSCVPAAEINALVSLYNSTNGTGWDDHTNWLSSDPATWFGVTVNSCHITNIDLTNNNLTGPLPAEIHDLVQLQELRLSFNSLSGNLPPTITDLTNLQYLMVDNNHTISGTLPASIGNMTSLLELVTQLNSFDGPIPATLASCTSLQNLQLEGNQHSGTIPPFLGSLTNLSSINLGFNQFSGNIPASLGSLPSLSFLSLASNSLTGTIPISLGSLDNLQLLDLSRNQLSGSIPAELGDLGSIHSLQLWSNQLTGTLPPQLSNLVTLQEINVGQNQLSGAIPSSLGNLSSLVVVNLRANQFTSIPTFTSTNITDLIVDNNFLDFGDLEPNLGKAGYVYSPQAKLPPGGTISLNEKQTLSIPFSTTGSMNQYKWFKNGVAIAGAATINFSKSGALPSDAGTYVLQVTSTLVTGLILQSNDYVVTVTPCAVPKPVISANGPLALCGGNSVTLSAPAGYSYTWSSGATSQQISQSTAGNFSVVLTDSFGCQSVSSDVVTVTFTAAPCNNKAPVFATASASTVVDGNISLNLISLVTDPDNNLDAASLSIVKQPASGAPATLQNGLLVVDYAGVLFSGQDVLTVSVCDMFGLCSQQVVQITVDGEITVYDGISPNGDAINDSWIIRNIDVLPDTKENVVTIFNQWGDPVFKTQNYDNRDRVFRGSGDSGNELSSGTYFYKIEFPSGRPTLTGYLVLKK